MSSKKNIFLPLPPGPPHRPPCRACQNCRQRQFSLSLSVILWLLSSPFPAFPFLPPFPFLFPKTYPQLFFSPLFRSCPHFPSLSQNLSPTLSNPFPPRPPPYPYPNPRIFLFFFFCFFSFFSFCRPDRFLKKA